jgi:hypothetical protein
MCQLLSAHIQNSVVLTPIGISDSNQSSYDWRPGFQLSDNERPQYTALITGFQIGIWQGARSGLPNEIRIYEERLKLQQFTEIKGPIRKILKPVAVLVRT